MKIRSLLLPTASYKTPVALEGTTNLFAGRNDFSDSSKWYKGQVNSIAPTINEDGDMVLYGTGSGSSAHQSYTESRTGGMTALEPNTTYTLSLYVKHSSTGAKYRMYFYEKNSSGGSVKTTSPIFTPTADEVGVWVRRSITLTTQANTTQMYAELNCFNAEDGTTVIIKSNSIQLEAKDHATLYVNGTRANNTIVSAKPKIVLEGTTNLFPSQYQNAKFITGASGNTLNSAGSFSISCSTHGTYTLSGYYKLASTDTATNPRVTLCAKYSGDTNATQLVRTVGSQEKDDKWHYFAITGTTNASKTLTNLSGWIFDYSSAGSARNIECKCIQLEFKDHATYYTPSTRANNTII